jgi:hypothetical protein
MTKLVTNSFKVTAAAQLKDSIGYTNTNFYMFAGRHLAWDSDIDPPAVSETQQGEFYDVYSNMIFGKKIGTGDVKHAIRRVNWSSGTVYTMYDDTQDITANNYYVVVDDVDSQWSVFKCLDNAKGAASTDSPSVQDLGGAAAAASYTGVYQTGDSYIWKYMYGIPDATFDQFASDEYIPVEINSTVVNNAVDGSLQSIKVVDGGTNYNSYHTGYFKIIAYNGNTQIYGIADDADANNDFYTGSSIYIPATGEIKPIIDYTVITANPGAAVTDTDYNFKRIVIGSGFSTLPGFTDQYQIIPRVIIQGDGSGAVGRAVVNTVSNTINQIVVSSGGSGYTHADVTVSGNTGNSSAVSANVRAIISPPGGHGSDALNELDASQLIFSTKFQNTESSTVSVANDFRVVGILKDPLYANVHMTFASVSGTISDGNILVGGTSGAQGEIIDDTNPSVEVNVSNVAGHFVSGETLTEQYANGLTTGVTVVTDIITSHGTRASVVNDTFKQTTTLTFNYVSSNSAGIFVEDDNIYQGIASFVEANGYVQEITSSTIDVTGSKGVWTTSDTATGAESGYTELVTSVGGRAPIGDVTGVVPPDLKKNTGEVLYIENVQPISRASDQTETINLVIKF